MITIYNPLSEDYENTFDVNEDGNPVTYKIDAYGFKDFDNEAMAEHCIKHLSDMIVFTRKIKTNYKDEVEAIRKEIVV